MTALEQVAEIRTGLRPMLDEQMKCLPKAFCRVCAKRASDLPVSKV